MLDLKWVVENRSACWSAAPPRARRRADPRARRSLGPRRTSGGALLQKVEQLRHRQRVCGEEIARRGRAREDAARPEGGDEGRRGRDQGPGGAPAGDRGGAAADASSSCPTCPTPACPSARTPSANVEVRRVGEPPRVRLHAAGRTGSWARSSGILDFERAAKISGARFAVLVGRGARGWSARSSTFMLDLHTRERGYTEVIPPYLVTRRDLLRHRPAPEVRGRPLQDARGRPRPLPDPDRGGAAHRPAPRRDPGGGRPAQQVRVVHALLPLGGGLLRQGRARAHPPAPVPQGRAGQAHDARERRWRSWSRWSRTRRRS